MSANVTTNKAPTVAQRLAAVIVTATPEKSEVGQQIGRRLVMDIAGICLAARSETYVLAALASVEQEGQCTVLGFEGKFGVEAASFVNGIAAHGEDFDDTYEGGPVHAGVVVVPAMLAAAERHGLSGAQMLRGIAMGTEVMCRLCRVAPMRVHKAGFHPTAIFGVMGAVAGLSAALGLTEKQTVNALGIAGSMAGGIIEYLADGSWTKRMHPGWAAQSAYRAVRMAQAGFVGPATVFEGQHGLFHGFANLKDASEGDFEAMLAGFGEEWIWTTIAFKPYACGTMAHPFIDCARALRSKGIDLAQITRIECDTAEGIVHRLWEPLALKAAPPNAYAAKFSIPYAIAAGLVFDDAGLGEYAEDVVQRADVRALAAKVHYRVDPNDRYPRQFTGHVRITMSNGDVHEHRQDHFKGGAANPLSDAQIMQKFLANCRYGKVSEAQTMAILAQLDGLFDAAKVDISTLALHGSPPARG
jgi:2-methylcitrate dehydratase PrpD